MRSSNWAVSIWRNIFVEIKGKASGRKRHTQENASVSWPDTFLAQSRKLGIYKQCPQGLCICRGGASCITLRLISSKSASRLCLHHDIRHPDLTGRHQEPFQRVCISWLRAINSNPPTVCHPLIGIQAPAENRASAVRAVRSVHWLGWSLTLKCLGVSFSANHSGSCCQRWGWVWLEEKQRDNNGRPSRILEVSLALKVGSLISEGAFVLSSERENILTIYFIWGCAFIVSRERTASSTFTVIYFGINCFRSDIFSVWHTSSMTWKYFFI